MFEDCWFGNYEIYSPPTSPIQRTNECPDPLDRISRLTTKIKQRKDWNYLFFKCQRQILKLFLQAIEGSGKLRKADVNNYRSIRFSVSFLISFFQYLIFRGLNTHIQAWSIMAVSWMSYVPWFLNPESCYKKVNLYSSCLSFSSFFYSLIHVCSVMNSIFYIRIILILL